MRYRSQQRGELITSISLLSLAGLLLGLVIGTRGFALSGSPRSFLSKAQSCAYRTEILVLKKNRQGELLAVNDQEQFFVENNKGQSLELNHSGKSYDIFNDFIRLSPSGTSDPKLYQPQERATVRLKSNDLGSRYKVADVFCEQHSSQRGCPTQDQITTQREDPTATIRDFTVACDVDITYGWILEDIPSSPTISPSPIPTDSLTTPTPQISPLSQGGSIETKVYVVRSDDRPSGDTCTIDSLEKSVNTIAEGSDTAYYRGECRIDLMKVGVKIIDQKRDKDCNSVTFSGLQMGSYEVNLNKGRPTELLKVCSDARKNISVSDDKKTVPIVLWAPPERQCQVSTTCANCRQSGGKCITKLSANDGSSPYLCCGQNQSQEKSKPTPTPEPKGSVCQTKGSYCSDTYTESCPDGSQRICTKYGRCIIGDGVGDGSKCSWESPREDGRNSTCTPCAKDTTNKQDGLSAGKLDVELKNATDKTVTIEATIADCKKADGGSSETCSKTLSLPPQAKVSATFEELLTTLTHTLKVKTTPETPIKVLRCVNGNVANAGSAQEECSFSTVQGALASLELYIHTQEPPKEDHPEPPKTTNGYCSKEFLKPFFLEAGVSSADADKRLPCAMALCRRESGGDPSALADKVSKLSCLKNNAPAYAIGLFQISVFPWADRCTGGTAKRDPVSCKYLMTGSGFSDTSSYAGTCSPGTAPGRSCAVIDQAAFSRCQQQYFDPATNVKKMLAMSKNGADWTHWRPLPAACQ